MPCPASHHFFPPTWPSLRMDHGFSIPLLSSSTFLASTNACSPRHLAWLHPKQGADDSAFQGLPHATHSCGARRENPVRAACTWPGCCIALHCIRTAGPTMDEAKTTDYKAHLTSSIPSRYRYLGPLRTDLTLGCIAQRRALLVLRNTPLRLVSAPRLWIPSLPCISVEPGPAMSFVEASWPSWRFASVAEGVPLA